ncbi:MAG: TonB-dependent receptor [Candidatus Zixiibacteriota bacterium]
MKRILLLVTSLAAAAYGAGTGVLSGLVYEEVTERPAVGALVALSGTNLYATADENGYFVIDDVPAGTYVLKVSLVGYEARAVTDVVVIPGRRATKDISLKPVSAGVTHIRAENYFTEKSDASVSAHSMSKEEMRRQPGGAGDVYRVLSTLPGVNATDIFSDLVVRGGDPNENLTLLDDIEVFNPVHYGQTYGSHGAITALNLELIDDVEFYAGGYPAEYGDRMSGVLDISCREGDRGNYHVSTDMSMSGLGLIVEGPLGPNGSFVGSGRKSLLEVLSKVTDFTGIGDSVPRYYDTQGKVVYDLSPRHRLSFLGFYASDRIDIAEDKEYARSRAVKWLSNQRAWGLTWRWLYSDDGALTLTGYRTGNYWNIHAYNAFADNREQSEGYENALKGKLTYQLHPNVILRGGGSAKYVTLRSRYRGVASFTGTGEPINPYDYLYEPDTYKGAAFADTTVRPWGRLSLTVGGRADYLEYTDNLTVAPRTGAKVAVTDTLSLNAAYGQYYQSPMYTSLAVNDLSNGPALYSGRADHYIAGLTYLLRPDLELGVEGYYKNLFDLPTTAVHNGERMVRNAGSGYARGGEVYYHKKLSGRLFTRGTYSYLASYRRLRDGQELFPSTYDMTHSFTVLGGYEPWKTWLFSAKFKFASGRPYTPVVGSYYDPAAQQWFRIDGDVNSARYSSYHRLDLRFDKAFYRQNWSLTTYFDLQNVYDAKNVFAYDYSYDYSEREESYQWGMMPVGGFILEF